MASNNLTPRSPGDPCEKPNDGTSSAVWMLRVSHPAFLAEAGSIMYNCSLMSLTLSTPSNCLRAATSSSESLDSSRGAGCACETWGREAVGSGSWKGWTRQGDAPGYQGFQRLIHIAAELLKSPLNKIPIKAHVKNCRLFSMHCRLLSMHCRLFSKN